MLENQQKLLIDSLKNLGLSYQEQEKIFPDFVDIMDEILSDFDNAFRLLPEIMDKKAISYNAVRSILYCHNLIELNLSITERITDESFESGECWQLVRNYANESLRLINCEI